DPEPVRLTSQRDHQEGIALVGRRLRAVYDEEELPVEGLPSTFPFTAEQLGPLASLRTRDVLTHCLRHQERWAAAGEWAAPTWGVGTGTPVMDDPGKEKTRDVTALEQLWNDFHAAFKAVIPDEDAQLAELVRWAVEQVSGEMATGHHFGAETNG